MAWYDIFYKMFSRREADNNFYENPSGSEKIENICKGDESVIREHGNCGFGVGDKKGDVDSYTKRPGVQENYERVRNSRWWKKIYNQQSRTNNQF